MNKAKLLRKEKSSHVGQTESTKKKCGNDPKIEKKGERVQDEGTEKAKRGSGVLKNKKCCHEG